MKWIDIPPLWLALCLALAWWAGAADPWNLSFGGAWADFVGGLLVGAGLLLMLLAVTEMRRRRTTVIPHREAEALVTTGLFRFSRNPIYLGDLLVLAGFILRWDAAIALPLVPLFAWVIERRFILLEEARLRRRFHADFARYCAATRRWL